jgi:hypothetical protein
MKTVKSFEDLNTVSAISSMPGMFDEQETEILTI